MNGLTRGSVLRLWFAAVAALILAFALFAAPKTAYADESIDVGNGWVLTYAIADGSATITGASAAGSGELVIPSEIGGAAVKAFATSAFQGSGVTSVCIPDSVEGVSAGCFRDCKALTKVEFENDQTGYLGAYAFSGCTALTEFAVPVLNSPSKDYGGNTENYYIGSRCFEGCTNLEKVEFLSNGGDVDGYMDTYSAENMKKVHFGDCNKLKTFVFFCRNASFTRLNDTAEGTKWYYTLDVYASQDDAGDYSKRAASITCLSGTRISDILDGSVSAEAVYRSTGSIPALPAGKVWGVSDYGRAADDWGLYGSYQAYPVDANDLSYGWATSPEIKELTDKGWQDVYWDYARAVFTLNKAGTDVPGLAGVVVHAGDGSLVDPREYAIELEARIMGSGGIYTDKYEKVSSISKPGLYRLRAVATNANPHAGSATDYVEMKVAEYSLSQIAYGTTGDAVFATASSHAGRSAYSVVVPSSSWQYAMIGTGLAAAGNGVLVESARDSISSASLRAIIANGADSVLVLGGGSEISQAVVGQINGQSIFANGGGVTPMTATSVQDMAVQAYNNIDRYGASRFAHTAEWGTAALVMSPNDGFNTASAALYAAAKKAPVFFANSDGTLPSAVASILNSGKFNEVAVVGSERVIPAATAQQISSSGVNVVRLLDSGTNSGEANRSFVTGYADALGLSAAKVVVASMTNRMNVILGAQVAVDNGGVLYTCASTEDGKAIQGLADSAGALNVWRIGPFDAVDPQLSARISSIATSSPMSTKVGNGDTFEQAGVLYGITAAGRASLKRLFDTSVTSFTVAGSVNHAATNYTIAAFDANALKACSNLATLNVASTSITSIPASAYAGLAKLKSVSYAGNVSSIGANAFNGCTALTTLNANIWKASSIGASAFANCKSLTKATLSSTTMTAIPANAFKSCSKLSSLQFKSTKIKSIGASAFASCPKLKTITLKTTKLKKAKVGANAFKGIAAKAKVKVPKKKVPAYKKIFKAKGLPKKAKVVAA